MRTIELLEQLKKHKIKFWLQNDDLYYEGHLPEVLQTDFVEHKQSIVHALKKMEHKNNTSSIHSYSKPDRIPLSFAQYRLWFIEQLQPGDPSYNIQDARRITGKLDMDILTRALHEIVLRQESLRTTFHEYEGEPFQQINSQVHYCTQSIDLQRMEKHTQDQMIKKIMTDDLFKSFNFSDSLFRTTIIQLGEYEHILLLSMHHIISDGWSMGILFKELNFYYQFFEEQAKEPLPPLKIQYSDYAIWQQEQLNNKQLEKKLHFWKHNLKGAPGLIELPHDLPRIANTRSKGASYLFLLPEELSASLESICKQQHATIFMGLFTLYTILLYRYTHQKDLIVGTITANRDLPEIEDMIGFFVNTLPIRTEIEEECSFMKLLEQVSDACLQAYNHQEVPFEMIVDEMNPSRDLSYNPLIQTICIMQNQNIQGELSLSTLKVEPLEIEYDLIKFDLSLVFSKSSEGISCYVGYNEDLFTETRIKDMMDSYVHLLHAAVNDPKQSISRLTLISDEQRNTLIARGQKQITYTDDICIHEWFEHQVDKYPYHTAVTFDDERLTYVDLNRRANQLAHFMIEAGSVPGERVGLCLERSLDMIIGILAVLKAGATYVPIDPHYPEQRKTYIIDDSQIKTLITSIRMKSSLSLMNRSMHFIFVEEENIQLQKSENTNLCIDSNQLAYIIYTSGTTGNPKGVMIPHSNVIRLFRSTEQWFQFNDQDKWTQFHSFAFDFSVWEIWGALFYGGELVIVPYWISRSTDDFYQLVVSERITVMNQTPSAFYQFIKSDELINDQLYVRYVIFGGEALEPQRLNSWLEKHGDTEPQLINMYGITETTVHVTYRQIFKNESQHSMIGQKIPDLELYVLDPFLEPAPRGVAGEIYVGGAGVAQGYLNLPELTSQKFIANPFYTNRTERLYRTGDIGRYNNEYDLEYMGRQDDQVKIRGYRIELGEIQRNLELHPAVQQSLITVYDNVQGDKGLLAYYTVKNTVKEDELRAHLQSIVPGHLIPDWFMEVQEFALNQNGKIDKKMLPTLQDKPLSAREIMEPATPTEKVVQSIWMNILGMEWVSTMDNFFDIGGNSFNAVRLIRKIEKECDVRLPISFIFQFSTIHHMSLAIDQKMLGSDKDCFIELQKGNNNQVLAFIHPIGGNLFCYQQLIKRLPSGYTVYGFEAHGLHDSQKALHSIRQMAKAYINELMNLQNNQSTLVGWSMGGIIAYEMGLQIYDQTEIAPALVMIDSWSSNMGSPAISHRDMLHHFSEDLLKSLKIPVSSKTLQDISVEESIFKQLVHVIKEHTEGFKDIDTEQIENRFNVYRANLQALSEYRPERKYPGHITLLRADAKATEDHTLGWANWSEYKVNVISIPGDHYSILEEPGLSQIVHIISEDSFTEG